MWNVNISSLQSTEYNKVWNRIKEKSGNFLFKSEVSLKPSRIYTFCENT